MVVRTREVKQNFCFVYKQSQPMNCSSTCSWESECEKLISSEFWSVRLNIYMGNYFSVPLLYMVMTRYRKWLLPWNPRACNNYSNFDNLNPQAIVSTACRKEHCIAISLVLTNTWNTQDVCALRFDHFIKLIFHIFSVLVVVLQAKLFFT